MYALNADSWFFLYNPHRLVAQHIVTARPVLAALTWVVTRFGINIVQAQFWDGIIGIVLLALAVTALYGALMKRSTGAANRVLAFLIAFTITESPFVAEWFANAYISAFFCLAQLLCIGAAILLAQSRLRVAEITLAFVFVILSAGIYQSTLGLTIPLTIMLLMLDRAPLLLILKRSGIAFAALLAGAAIAYSGARFSMRLIGEGADPRLQQFHPLSSLKAVLSLQPEVWARSFSFIPKYVFFSLTCAAVLTLAVAPVSKRLKAGALAASVVLIAITFAPHIVTVIVYITPRSVTALCALIGILLAPSLATVDRRSRAAALTVLALWSLVIVLTSNRALADFISTYRLQLQEGRTIWNEIHAYETRTGERVTHLAMELDRAPTWCYESVHCYGEFNIRPIVKAYAQNSIMLSASGRSFQPVLQPPSLTEIFNRDNWDELSPDEVKCVGDTAYVAVY